MLLAPDSPEPTPMTTRLRFAPSPTGSLHIGGARTALFNWAFARREGGVFVLRVEDTDRQRSTPEFEEAILDGLRWLGLDWDEGPGVGGPFGPYRQTERFDRYREIAERLLEQGAAYRCFCTPERLEAVREAQRAAGETPAYDKTCRDLDRATSDARAAAGEPFVLRFRVPEEGETVVRDLVTGDVTFQNKEVDDWIMVRADGTPTYNFCVVCDDTHMQITHVLRGEEHLTNTPKQVLLFEALGLEPPLYAHLPLMLGTDGKKLSKRTGDTALQDYRDKGYPPEAVANFLCLQGWGLDETTTVFSLEELIANFHPKDVRRGGSIFDVDKFQWLAGEYLRAEPIPQLASRCAPYVAKAGLATEAELEERAAWFEAVVASERERIKLYSELPARIAYLFQADDEVVYEEKAEKNAKKHEDRVAILTDFLAWLEPRFEAYDAEATRAAGRDWVGERGIKFPVLFQPLRCALMGAAGGADLFDVIGLLGPERTRARIHAACERLA